MAQISFKNNNSYFYTQLGLLQNYDDLIHNDSANIAEVGPVVKWLRPGCVETHIEH